MPPNGIFAHFRIWDVIELSQNAVAEHITAAKVEGLL
jgi:hypothetical protein